MYCYIDLFLKWLSIVPSVAEWATPVNTTPNLHLINNEASKFKLGITMIQTMILIFGNNMRSKIFFKTSNSLLRSKGLPEMFTSKDQSFNLAQVFYLNHFCTKRGGLVKIV